jgi:glucose/arabinose dehydrogenase
MIDNRQSRCAMANSMPGGLSRSTLWASLILCPLTLGSGPAFGQADELALSADAPMDQDADIRVPEGFDAEVFAEEVGRARHIAVRDNGDVYVALREARAEGSVAALRDEDGDGAADRVEYFGEHAGTGTAIHDGFLYASSDDAIFRYPLPEGDALVPQSGPETVVQGFPRQRSHASKAFAIDDSGNLYVNVGAPSNACQEADRTRGSPGQEPCPLLDDHAGIWRFDGNKSGQNFEDGARHVTGTRNVVALDWNSDAGALYFAMHGRD